MCAITLDCFILFFFFFLTLLLYFTEIIEMVLPLYLRFSLNVCLCFLWILGEEVFSLPKHWGNSQFHLFIPFLLWCLAQLSWVTHTYMMMMCNGSFSYFLIKFFYKNLKLGGWQCWGWNPGLRACYAVLYHRALAPNPNLKQFSDNTWMCSVYKKGKK